VEVERRNFLRGRFKPLPDIIRPPYAIVENDFLVQCERCPDCASSCEEKVIQIDDAGYPNLSFVRGECTFCGACLTACKTGALDREKARPWFLKARIGEQCLSVNAIYCRTCGEYCEEEAIVFRLMTGGRSLPVVDGRKCTGCGACAFVCPNKSVEMVVGHKSEDQKLQEGSV
jgi:ferredoxin-type protein NapF